MRNFLLLNILFISTFAFSQRNYDLRLNAKYSDEYLQSISVDELNSLEFRLNNVYIIEDNFEKLESLPELKKVNNSTKELINEPISNIDFSNFNILEYYFKQKYDNRNYYKIGDTGKTLVILSMKEYVEKLNEFKN